MPGYQRFVAYVYEYRKGIKEENCGYIRVEAREEQCKIEVHVKCPGLPASEICEVKGIVRKAGTARAVNLGNCMTIQDAIQCLIVCQTEDMDHEGVSLSEIGGLLLLTQGGAFFGTEWDDVPIIPDEFLYPKEQNESESHKRNATIAEVNEIKVEVNEDETSKTEDINKGENDKDENGRDEDNKGTDNRDGKQRITEEILPTSKKEENKAIEQPNKNENLGNIKELEDLKDTDRLKSSDRSDNSGRSDDSDRSEIPIEAELSVQALPENMEDSREEQRENQTLSEVQMSREYQNSNIPENQIASEMQGVKEHQNISEKQTVSEMQNSKTVPRVYLPGEAFEPFSDGEISECRKILPQAIYSLAPCDRSLRNNRFLMHGYYNFGHLLLGKTTSGKYIIGVPGGYDQQERFMAGMHGFPYFKESQEIRLRQSKGGYWYRLIHTPNFDKRNAF